MMKVYPMIFLLVLAGMLVACNTLTATRETAASEQTVMATSSEVKTATPFTTAPEPIHTPTVRPITPTATFTRKPTETPMPTFSPTPTVTWTPTARPTADPEILQVCGIGRVSPKQQDNQVIYFRTTGGDWYRTADQFATTEWFAPAGSLSPDAKTLVIFDCEGPGSICVASPPQSTPVILAFRYEPAQSGGGYKHWLPDGQRLVFMADYSLPGEGTIDRQFYLLDLRMPQLRLIASMPMFDWAVSPLGTCIAYTTWDDDGTPRFHLTNVETDVWNDWIAPKGDLSRKWPGWAERIAWSPDGSRLAFTEAPRSIIVWNLVNDSYEQYGTGGFPDNLKWSPDGYKIYFTATGSKGGRFHWILNLNTGEIRELGELHGEGSSSAYLWLANGREIIVADRFGSLVLDTTDGSTEKLIYPGSERGSYISELFFGSPPNEHTCSMNISLCR